MFVSEGRCQLGDGFHKAPVLKEQNQPEIYIFPQNESFNKILMRLQYSRWVYSGLDHD